MLLVGSGLSSTGGGSRGASALSVCSAPEEGWEAGLGLCPEAGTNPAEQTVRARREPETSRSACGQAPSHRPLLSRGPGCTGAGQDLLPGSQPLRPRSELTTGCALCLATPLLFELSARACGRAASCLVQPAQRGGSSLLFLGSLVSSWRQNTTDLSFFIKCQRPEGRGGS